MPNGLTPRATVLLVGLAFGLTFSLQALLGGGSSPTRPAQAKHAIAGSDAPAVQPDLRLVATGSVPTLREPRKPHRRRVRKPKRTVRKVVRVAPRRQPAPVVPTATAEPAPTAAPRYIPPAPRSTPAPAAPKRTPAPAPTTTPPSSGQFDTSGEQ